MKYDQIPVPAYLKDCVQSISQLEEEGSNGRADIQSFQLIADASPGLIFQHADYGVFYKEDKQLPTAFVFGSSTTHSTLALTGSFKTLGIFFYPNALKTIFGLNASQLTDTCIDLNVISGAANNQIGEKLLNGSCAEEKVSLISDFVNLLKQDNLSLPDQDVAYAISEILATGGNITLSELREKLRLSERTIERKFKENVGVSPKLFSRICQFQTSLKQLKLKSHEKLSDIAFENEFSDQSHFIRAFKEFSGFTPNAYARKSRELVENLAQHLK